MSISLLQTLSTLAELLPFRFLEPAVQLLEPYKHFHLWATSS